MTMGKNRFKRGLLVMCALSLLISMPACRKLGLDDSPRVMPNGEMPPVGPKRQPMAQHSSINTPEAVRAAQTGAISADPSSMASVSAPVNDSFAAAYSGNNFWANGAGWSATPPATPVNAAPPTPQMAPSAMIQPQPMSPMTSYGYGAPSPMMMNPTLPSMAALAPQPSPFGNSFGGMNQGMPMQQQAFNGYGNAAPQFNPVGSFGMQQTPPAPQQFGGNQMAMPQQQEFPQLQDTPNSPFYRSQQEIAGDINSLQNQSLGYGWQNTPSFPTSPAGNFSQPVALQDNYNGGGYDTGSYAGGGYGNGGYGQDPAMASQGGYGTNNGMNPQLAPPPSFNSTPDLFGGQQPQSFDSAGFVPPAPIAGVSDAPIAAAQDWDRQAYAGQQGGNSAYSANQPLQLQAPYGSGRNPNSFLPNSRYQGRNAGHRANAVPATLDYGGY